MKRMRSAELSPRDKSLPTKQAVAVASLVAGLFASCWYEMQQWDKADERIDVAAACSIEMHGRTHFRQSDRECLGDKIGQTTVDTFETKDDIATYIHEQEQLLFRYDLKRMAGVTGGVGIVCVSAAAVLNRYGREPTADVALPENET